MLPQQQLKPRVILNGQFTRFFSVMSMIFAKRFYPSGTSNSLPVDKSSANGLVP